MVEQQSLGYFKGGDFTLSRDIAYTKCRKCDIRLVLVRWVTFWLAVSSLSMQLKDNRLASTEWTRLIDDPELCVFTDMSLSTCNSLVCVSAGSKRLVQ